jgi:hypothetical protein
MRHRDFGVSPCPKRIGWSGRSLSITPPEIQESSGAADHSALNRHQIQEEPYVTRQSRTHSSAGQLQSRIEYMLL